MGDGGVFRMNISVPRDLKARMDKVKGPVNWSAVAAQAFEAKLLELESQRREVKDMEEVLARLKAAAAVEENEDYQAGLRAGEEWAKRDATPKQLRRVAIWAQGNRSDWWDVDSTGWLAPFGATDYFAFAATPDRNGDRDFPEEFWQKALGDDAGRVNDADFFHGFGDGAVALWERVSDKL